MNAIHSVKYAKLAAKFILTITIIIICYRNSGPQIAANDDDDVRAAHLNFSKHLYRKN